MPEACTRHRTPSPFISRSQRTPSAAGVLAGPLHKFDLRDQYRREPDAFRHLAFSFFNPKAANPAASVSF
jgi:hypothetical protein